MERNELIEKHYINHRSELIKYARFKAGLSPESAEDVVHEAYVRAIRYFDAFDPTHKKFEQWFFRIFQRAIINQVNFDKGVNEVGLDEREEEFIECSGIDLRIMAEVLQRIEGKIPPHREVLIMHFKLGYKPADIAEITSLTATNCYQIIHRFYDELKKVYKHED